MHIAAATILATATGLAHANTAQPSQDALTQAVKQYLVDHGDLCVGKRTWPRDLTAEDAQSHSNDAIQLPVLERLGIVKSTVIPAPAAARSSIGTSAQQSQTGAIAGAAEPARRYSLTSKGQQYYLQKKRITLGVHGEAVEQDADLCVARLSLDKVIKWSPPEQVNGHTETVVHYTYHVKSADWMEDPEARKVFPVVDRIIGGQGNLLMSVTAQLQDGKWVPVLPGQ